MQCDDINKNYIYSWKGWRPVSACYPKGRLFVQSLIGRKRQTKLIGLHKGGVQKGDVRYAYNCFCKASKPPSKPKTKTGIQLHYTKIAMIESKQEEGESRSMRSSNNDKNIKGLLSPLLLSFYRNIGPLPPPKGFQFTSISDLRAATIYKLACKRDGAMFYFRKAAIALSAAAASTEPSGTTSNALALSIADHICEYAHMVEVLEFDSSSASAMYKDILSYAPDHAKALQRLGWVIHQDNPGSEMAFQLLSLSLKNNDRDGTTWYYLAHYHWVEGNLDICLKNANKAIRIGADLHGCGVEPSTLVPSALHLKALCLHLKDAFAEGEETLKRALFMEPGNAEMWIDLAQMLEDQGQWFDATAAYKRALKLEPHRLQLFSYITRIQADRKLCNLF